MGRKGYIILPKSIRETVGIDEGDEVIVETPGGGGYGTPRPAKRGVDVQALRASLRTHAERLRKVPGRREPRPGELAGVGLEEEFEG